ncbi:hypothetical protein [Aliiroseovarius zhejiangensis]|nr:hypothetical protein [Aliiroseovarius zhejiangensis]
MTNQPSTEISEIPGSIDQARLPATYAAAKTALATCQNVDECKDWSDKAQALASYAKQAQDEELEAYARRIRNRAIRRMGEVLQNIEPAANHHGNSTGGDAPTTSRAQAAREAGISKDQQVQAVRVARVPEQVFEDKTEADRPATITQLADIGRKRRPSSLDGRDPAKARECKAFIQDTTRAIERLRAWRSVVPHMTESERNRLLSLVASISVVCDDLEEATET